MLPVMIRRREGELAQDQPVWDVERVFNRVFNDVGWPTGLTANYPVDIHEDDDHVYVEAEMPGFKKDEVNITIEQGILTITAERKAKDSEKRENGKGQHLRERRNVRYQRFFTLPTTVDDSKVDARLEDGVLYLTFPKAAAVKPRRITVK